MSANDLVVVEIYKGKVERLLVRVCVGAWVRGCVGACVCGFVRVCVCACVHVCMRAGVRASL